MSPAVRITKRTIDVLFATVGLIVTLPLFIAIAALIRIDSKGAAIYRQRRCGPLVRGSGCNVECDEFTVFKFRTMRLDAESSSGPVLAREGDPRITRVGMFLRRSRLDELPQLINVLLGSMSLVGPRPERPAILRQLSASIPFFEERSRGLKPGITGYSQINLGYTGKPFEGSPANRHLGELTNPYRLPGAEGAVADEMRIKLLYDLAYAAACERLGTFLWMELGIIAKTPWIMLRGVGR